MDKHAPLKTRSFVVRPKLPWFNGCIKEAKKAKKRAEKKWRSSKNENDKEHFKSKRNEYLYLLNTAKQKYYSDKIEESQGDQRKLFKLVKSIMKPEESVKYPVSSSMENLTNELNEYFITKIDLIREKLDEMEMDTSPAEYLMDYKQVKEFSVFERLSEDQVKKLIMKSPNKQCAADPIPTLDAQRMS